MYGVLQRKIEESGNDRQERLMLSFEKMFAREKGTALWELFNFWLGKKVGNAELPQERDFIDPNHLPKECRSATAWIEAEVEDPFNFVVRNHPSMSAWENQSDRRLAELESAMNARSIATEYMFCKKMRQPMYYEIEQNVGSNRRHYVRLLLPVLNDTHNVTKLVYAVRMFSATGLKSPSFNS